MGQEIRDDGQVWYYVKDNGVIVHEVVNNNAQEMNNLHHWSGDDWYDACDGCIIRNFEYTPLISQRNIVLGKNFLPSYVILYEYYILY